MRQTGESCGDGSSKGAAAGRISASVAHVEAGSPEGGQEPKEGFPGPMAVAMARPTGGYGQVQGRALQSARGNEDFTSTCTT